MITIEEQQIWNLLYYQNKVAQLNNININVKLVEPPEEIFRTKELISEFDLKFSEACDSLFGIKNYNVIDGQLNIEVFQTDFSVRRFKRFRKGIKRGTKSFNDFLSENEKRFFYNLQFLSVTSYIESPLGYLTGLKLDRLGLIKEHLPQGFVSSNLSPTSASCETLDRLLLREVN